MPNKKSLTERVLELKEYLQPESVRRSILKTTVSALLAIKLFSYCLMPVAASEPLTVKKYIQQNNYNISSIFQLYLKSLNEDGLDENEKKAIDIIANAPEEKQEEGKALAKEIYNHKGLTQEILTKLENLNILSEKQEPVKGLEEKVTKETENLPLTYCLFVAPEHYKKGKGYAIPYMVMLYGVMKNKIGIKDDNIIFAMVNPDKEDFINTSQYKGVNVGVYSKYMPSNKEQIEVDDYNISLEKFLDYVSEIAEKADSNDTVIIFCTGHGHYTSDKKEVRIKFRDGYLTDKNYINPLKEIDAGKLIVMQESCYSHLLLKKLKNLENYILIASTNSDGKGFNTPYSEKGVLSDVGAISYILSLNLIKNPYITPNEFIKNSEEKVKEMKYSSFTFIYSNKSYLDEPLIPSNYLIK